METDRLGGEPDSGARSTAIRGLDVPTHPRCTHLHVHSHFSLLDGNPRVQGLVDAAANAGMDSLALTDHGNMFGAIEFFRSCQRAGIRPIPGMEAYIARKSRREKSGGDRGNFTDHITLLATSNEGYANLMNLTSLSYTEGFHYKPRIDKELLQEHGSGLIALSGCLSSEVSRAILYGDEQEVIRSAQTFEEIMGKGNYFLEVMNNGIDKQDHVRAALREIGKRTGIPLVATSDVHYLQRDDSLAQEVQLCIGMGTTLDDTNRMRMESDQFHFRTGTEMAEAFRDCPGAVERTNEIADRVYVTMPFGENHLPAFETPDGTPQSEFFRRLCKEGLERRYGTPSAQALERLAMEMKVIEEMGFVSYFLITWDFIRFARENGIPVGPGRGSAAGSLVSYALGITNLCPLKYDLLFERFLNSSRISMPDIDIDFCRDGRERVIEYVRNRYGADRVSQIVTFGTMAARAVIRDVGRVLGIELKEVDRITKKIPATPGTKLKDAFQDPELKSIGEESDTHAKLFDVARRLEGLNRHASTHAAGVVVGDQPLRDIVPLCTVQGEVNTQFTMGDLEALGLLKMDFLGLKTLTILDQAVKIVQSTSGVQIDLDALPLDDEPTYRLLQRGETAAVFQLESGGMRELLVKMRPTEFEDIIAILALYRPGPLGSGMVDSYVNRKRGVEEVIYPHPVLEDILRETKGILVYQEQVMRITNVLAGFTLNEADTLRKAMGKKKPEVMAEFREKFVSGAVANQCDEKTAVEIWETMEYFAGYGFNKSHSTAYGLITYWTAYMKANHPEAFMAAVITCEVSNSDKVSAYLTECRRMQIEVLPPSLRESSLGCTTDGSSLRLGLSTIKGLGDRAIEGLIAARDEAGEDASLMDALERLPQGLLNRSALEAMVKAGALDYLGATRASLSASIDALLQDAAAAQKDRRIGQGNLFAGMQAAVRSPALRIRECPEWPEREFMKAEKEVFGFYLSSNPLARYADLLDRHCTARVADLAGLEDGITVTVGGILGKPRMTTAKKGKFAGRKMAIFDVQGRDGSVSAIVFPELYETCNPWIEEDQILLLKGQLDLSRDEPSLKVAEVRPLDGILDEGLAGQLTIDLPTTKEDLSDELMKLRDIFQGFAGKNPVFLRFCWSDRPPTVHRVGERYFVRICDDLVELVEQITGQGTASLR
jgi:DNA polymerase-3 subunit alpha